MKEEKRVKQAFRNYYKLLIKNAHMEPERFSDPICAVYDRLIIDFLGRRFRAFVKAYLPIGIFIFVIYFLWRKTR